VKGQEVVMNVNRPASYLKTVCVDIKSLKVMMAINQEQCVGMQESILLRKEGEELDPT